MSKCSVVGKSCFKSKKSGCDCYVLHMVEDFPSSSTNSKGKSVRQQFVDENTYNGLTVPCEVDVSYNYRGYIDYIKVVR